MSGKLSWSHYIELLSIKDKNIRSFYEKEAENSKWSVRMLKEPYVFEFLGIKERKPILEKELEKRLINHIEEFLLELGKGFM